VGSWPWGKGAPTFGVSLNISATDEASKFKSGTTLVFTKTHHKITPRGKGSVARGYGIIQNSYPSTFLQWLKQASSNLAHSWCLPKPIIKSHAEEKVRMARG